MSHALYFWILSGICYIRDGLDPGLPQLQVGPILLIERKWIAYESFELITQTVESTTIICYIILITVSNAVVKHLALIVATACAGSAYPVIWPERVRALEGTVAAGIGIGLTNAMAQFSGIAGPYIYDTVFGPKYRISYIICQCFLCAAILGILSSWWLVGARIGRTIF
jgi:hypothetical protein